MFRFADLVLTSYFGEERGRSRGHDRSHEGRKAQQEASGIRRAQAEPVASPITQLGT